jgi:hypothetical protein
MHRFVDDLRLGARLAATGGFDARLRAALTAMGVAFGVALLLLAASVPNMLSEHQARQQDRHAQFLNRPTHLVGYHFDQTFHGNDITVFALQQTGPHPPLPPGINHIPAPGQMLVSPALASLLHTPAGHELAKRLDAHVTGTIADSGLSGPADLFAYRGGTHLLSYGGAAIIGFGRQAGPSGHDPLIILLVILMVVALLMPVGVFVATASRFGSEQRNQRLAALRLLGLDRAGTARVAAGEALFGAVIGALAGVVGFGLIVRPLVPHTDIAGISIFEQDVRASPALAALALVLVLVAAVAFALLGMRHVAVEPLGVSRRGRPPRRRLAWRLCTPGIGFLLLLGLVGASGRLASTGGEIEASAGIILVLIGVCALLPWFVEAAVVRAGRGAGGTVSWLLAVRRLRLDHGTSGRVVGAIGLAVAGAIALQTGFSGAESARNSATPAALRGVVVATEMHVSGAGALDPVTQRLSALHGVSDVVAIGSTAQNLTVSVAPCATIETLMQTTDCDPDSSYLVNGLGSVPHPGQQVRIDGRSFRVPGDASAVSIRPSYSDPSAFMGLSTLLVTPGTAARLRLKLAAVSVTARVAGSGDAEDRFRDAVATIDPLAREIDLSTEVSQRELVLSNLERILDAGAIAVLLVIGASLLVSVVEQLRERRRVFAVMAAFGTRASTLACSVLWQTALPVMFGLVLATLLGAALGAVLMKIASLPISFDWGSIALLAGAGVGVVAAVTALTLPILVHQIDPEALRAE